jgi:hypothetical protein
MNGAEYFRAMIPDTVAGTPAVGATARHLGVRDPQDIRADGDGVVHPETGGMSVAPTSMWNVPHHRRPRGMGRGSTGPAADWVFAIADTALPADLAVRPDPEAPKVHAFVEPRVDMLLSRLRDLLAGTRQAWRKVWP